MDPINHISLQRIDGTELPIHSLRNKVLLVVNTASACGFTPQFASLQALHEEFAPKGLVVIGFPCNQFGAQDPGTNTEIASFCERNWGVTFPMMEKADVNGPGAHPLFQWLSREAPGLLGSTVIKWNFTKFLVSRDRRSVTRFAPQVSPLALRDAIASALAT